jgi:hypothetical protein
VAIINEIERCGSLLPFDIITRTRALAPERTDDKGPDRATMPTARAKSAAVTVLAPEVHDTMRHGARGLRHHIDSILTRPSLSLNLRADS